MMKMKKKFSMILTTVLAGGMLLAGCGQEATSSNTGANGDKAPDKKEAKVININLGHTLTDNSERQEVALKLAELAKEKSDGTINISIFPSGQLGGEVKQIQSVRSGTQGMLFTSSAALTNTVPEYFTFDLPYLFDSAEQVDKILAGDVGKQYLDMLEQHDMVGLGFAWPNERNIFSDKPIKSPADLKGFKTRVLQAPGYVKTYEDLGAQPSPMAYGEVFLAVQQGVINGADVPPDQFVMDKFAEVAKYYNKTKIHYVPIVVAISKMQWDSMTPDQQKALQEATDEALDFGREYNKTYYDKYYDEMEKAGVEIVEPDIDSFKEATKGSYDAILKDVPNGQELLKAIQEAK
jgi:TRAP-type transport system periplasmic protein